MNIAETSYLYVFFIVLAILTDYLPFVSITKNMMSLSISSVQTIKANDIEDNQKEKILLANSLKILLQSFKIIAFIMLIAAAGSLLLLTSVFFKTLTYWGLIAYIFKLTGVLITLLSFFSYWLLKKLYVKIRL